MLIIIEGADCARKTTLAQDVMDRLKVIDPNTNTLYMHAGPPKSHPYVEYALPFAGYTPGGLTHYVVDRWHWGEMIYPSILNRKTDMDQAKFEWIEEYMYWLGAICVLLDPPLHELETCLKSRGDDMIGVVSLSAIKERFKFIAQRSIIATNFIAMRPTPDSVIANAMGSERRAIERNNVAWRSRPRTDK